MSVTLDHETAVAELTDHAEGLDEQRLWELATFALRVRAGLPVQRPEFDDDPKLALLKACIPLSREDKRSLNAMLAKLVRAQPPTP